VSPRRGKGTGGQQKEREENACSKKTLNFLDQSPAVAHCHSQGHVQAPAYSHCFTLECGDTSQEDVVTDARCRVTASGLSADMSTRHNVLQLHRHPKLTSGRLQSRGSLLRGTRPARRDVRQDSVGSFPRHRYDLVAGGQGEMGLLIDDRHLLITSWEVAAAELTSW